MPTCLIHSPDVMSEWDAAIQKCSAEQEDGDKGGEKKEFVVFNPSLEELRSTRKRKVSRFSITVS